MPTFLVTNKMSPELAARVAARVRGSGSRGAESRSPRLVLLARVAIAGAVLALVFGIVRVRRADAHALEAERGALLHGIAAKARQLSPDDRRVAVRVEALLAGAAARYDGDVLADELRSPGALRALLARPALYARVDAAAAAQPGGVVAASSPTKDAFVLCLLDPPAQRSEAALLRKVHVAYSTHSRLEAPTANVRVLPELTSGMPFLSDPFLAQVRDAQAMPELRRLRKAFEQAPVATALEAAKARLFLSVVDEPSERGVIAELDGEKAHAVRVELTDLAKERVLLRVRKRVDPAWISPARRSEYARGLDSCALALDVHAAVSEWSLAEASN